MTLDAELLSFAAQLLEQKGGVVEKHSDYLEALLPKPISRVLELPEDVRIGEKGATLLYGSPLLERLVDFATQDVPVVFGELQVPYLKKSGFEQLLAQDISFGKVQSRIINVVEARHAYMALECHYLAMSDERKEGLIEVVLHEDTGAVIPEMSGRWSNFQPKFFSPNDVPPHFPTHLDDAVTAAMKNARTIIDTELADFFKSIRRHLHRDVRNTQEYYQALKREMEASLEHSNLSEQQRNERKDKIKELPDEMFRKIEDLQQKYQTQITLTACAALRFLVPVVKLTVAIRYRKLSREIRLIFNPVSQKLDPLVCERCRATTRSVFPWEKDSNIGFYCSECYKKIKV